jgi:hypothetical protein
MANDNGGSTIKRKPPIFGNGEATTYKNGEIGGWFMIILPTF